MEFREFVSLLRSSDLGDPGTAGLPPRDHVRAVQNALGAALATEEFVIDCLEIELAHAGEAQRPPDLWVVPERGIHVRLVRWAPGVGAGPHEHTSWTVTGVIHNRLEIQTYRMEDAYARRELVPKNRFFADRGAVGHIYEPCIHEPRNTTERGAASIHVFNENDRPRIEAEVGPIAGLGLESARDRRPAGARAVTPNERLMGVCGQQVAMLLGFRSERAFHHLEAIYRLGNAPTRVFAARALLRFDRPLAERRLREAFEAEA
jgi:hypothetical protein